MGGTAVAIHLRHRVSNDLDVMTLRRFSGTAQEKRLRAAVGSVDTVEASADMFHGYVDGVRVDMFRALPSGSVEPSRMRWIAPATEISAMKVGSIPDLVATKLDLIRHRATLRDYIDLAALDRSGACSLEAGLGYYCRRFGFSYPPPVLEEITRLLEDPGMLPADPDHEDRRSDALGHLHSRVPDLRERIAELRDSTVGD